MEDDWITLTYWLPINTLSGLCPATSLGKYFMHRNLMKCADIIYSLTIIYRWSFNPSKINRFKSNVVPIVNQIQRKNQIRRFRKKRRRNVSTPSQTLAWILHTRFEKEWKAWGKHTNTMLERFSGKRWTQKKHETALPPELTLRDWISDQIEFVRRFLHGLIRPKVQPKKRPLMRAPWERDQRINTERQPRRNAPLCVHGR